MEDVNKKHETIRNKYWKSEWKSMTKEEKMKDPEYKKMLYFLIENTYQSALQKLEKAKGTDYEEKMQDLVEELRELKDMLKPDFLTNTEV